MLSLLYGPTHTSIYDYWKSHSFDYTYLCWQSNVSAFQYVIEVCCSFSLKEEASFNFVTAVTIYSDFGAQENKVCYCFHCFPIYLPLSVWLPDAKNWLIEKDPDAWKDWRQEEKGTTEDEMVEWHHQLNGHEFEQSPRVGDGQESLACRSPSGHKESGTTAGLDWTELKYISLCFL